MPGDNTHGPMKGMIKMVRELDRLEGDVIFDGKRGIWDGSCLISRRYAQCRADRVVATAHWHIAALSIATPKQAKRGKVPR